MVTACAESPESSPAEWDGPTYEIELTANEPGVIHVTALLPQTPTRLQMSGNGAGQLSDGWATFVTDLKLTDEAQDVEIRTSTANRRSIDDVMRAMYERYAGSSDEFDAADVEQTIDGLSEHDPATGEPRGRSGGDAREHAGRAVNG